MENVPTVQYDAGEVIIREGEPSNNVYLIISGKVKVTKKDGHNELTLAIQGKNTIFGEMTLIDGKRRSATVTAMEETYCYKCSASSLISAVAKLPSDLRYVLQGLVSAIRKNNAAKTSSRSDDQILNNPNLLFDEQEDKNNSQIRESEINSPKIQQAINDIENAFIRSLFRVLTLTAFHNK